MRKRAAALIVGGVLVAFVAYREHHATISLLNTSEGPLSSSIAKRPEPESRPSNRQLFFEAVAAAKAGDGPRWYIFTEIAKAQAVDGDYDDAIATASLVQDYPDQLFVQLVRTRAKNGDVAGAKRMAAGASTATLRSRADDAIAVAQAEAGDFIGAHDTSRDLPDKSSVLEAIGTRQASQGDLEGALRTASEMEWSDPVLFAVAEKLQELGNRRRAHEIALRITDPDMAQNADSERIQGLARPKDACEAASNDAKSGKYADGYNVHRTAKCDCRDLAYIYQAAGDPTSAATAMRSCPNLADVSAGMAGLAKIAAQRGNVSEALSFADLVHVSGASFEEGYLAPALRDIGRAWGSSADALNWARSRPTGYQRAMALLGLAESVSSRESARQTGDRK